MDDESEDQEYFPPVTHDLITALEKAFPNVCPDLRITDKEFGVIVGRLEVVRFLRTQHELPSKLKET